MARDQAALVLLAVLGAVSAFVMRPRAAQAAADTCSIPKSAGTFRGTSGDWLVFEETNGTLNVYSYQLSTWPDTRPTPTDARGSKCSL